MEKVLEITAKSLSEFFQTKYIAFFQLSESEDELILKYASGFHPQSHQNLRRIRPTIGIFQRLIEKRTFQIENEIFTHEQEFASLVKLDGLESMIGVPIFSKGNIRGILAFFSQERYKFKKEDGEVLNLWGAQMGELQDFLSSYLQTRLDDNLVQILGNIELLKFRLRNRKSIQVSDILDALDHLENAILDSSQTLDRICEEPTLEEKSEEKLAEEISTEEVITIQGEKIASMEKRKVLIVDDQPIITDLLVDILKRIGYNSEVALGGKDGLKIFAKDGFDLVITDLSMPDISGWEVSKSVKRQNPFVPVILITGWGVEPDPHKMKDSGVDFVINKPFQIDQLEKIIKRIINLKKDGGAV
ncbi:MAG: response regulator [candidate division Zixibacteria bacterium]|nr:response regulator [candidate division Zixibacteria bacterium]